MKNTRTYIIIGILIVLSALFITQYMAAWPPGDSSPTVKCGSGWVDIGYDTSAMATSCSSSSTVINIRLPWDEELTGVRVSERVTKEFRNPNNENEWLYVWPIGCSSSGTYFVVNSGMDEAPAPDKTDIPYITIGVIMGLLAIAYIVLNSKKK